MTSPQGNIFQITWPSCYESFLRNIKKEAICTSDKNFQNPELKEKKKTYQLVLEGLGVVRQQGPAKNSAITKTALYDFSNKF